MFVLEGQFLRHLVQEMSPLEFLHGFVRPLGDISYSRCIFLRGLAVYQDSLD
jgi:hypothetical protein